MNDKLNTSSEVGNAKVDAYVTQSKIKQGSTLSGEVYIVGGEAEQEINGVYISVMTSVLVEENGKKSIQDVEIQRFKASEGFTISPKEKKSIPFSFILSPETPMTVKRIEVWLKTMLDVPFECNPRDKDYIHVLGTEAAEKILSAVQQLDFAIKKVTNLKSRRTYNGVIQEFEFYAGGEFKKHFSEMELVLLSDGSGTTAYIEVGPEAEGTKGLLAQALDQNESKLFLHYRYGDIPSVEKISNHLHDLLLSVTK